MGSEPPHPRPPGHHGPTAAPPSAMAARRLPVRGPRVPRVRAVPRHPVVADRAVLVLRLERAGGGDVRRLRQLRHRVPGRRTAVVLRPCGRPDAVLRRASRRGSPPPDGPDLACPPDAVDVLLPDRAVPAPGDRVSGRRHDLGVDLLPDGPGQPGPARGGAGEPGPRLARGVRHGADRDRPRRHLAQHRAVPRPVPLRGGQHPARTLRGRPDRRRRTHPRVLRDHPVLAAGTDLRRTHPHRGLGAEDVRHRLHHHPGWPRHQHRRARL